jgi:hypothetical protein
MIAHKEKGYGAVVMTNGDMGSPLCGEIVRGIAREYGWKDYLPEELDVLSLEPEELDSYTGRFLRHRDDVLTCYVENGKLFARDYMGLQSELFAVAEDKFADLKNVLFLQFKRSDKGVIDKADIMIRGRRAYSRSRVEPDYVAPVEYVIKGEHEKALEAYRQIKTENPKDRAVRENRLDSLGFEFLRAGKTDMAVSVFLINTQLYPGSANTYDSLAYTYREMGEINRAIEFYKKTLAAIPTDTSRSRNFLENLRESAQKALEELERKKQSAASLSLPDQAS